MNSKSENSKKTLDNPDEKYEVATFAGGCFWCVEAAYEKYEGVIKAVSGYSGGTKENAVYQKVAASQTNHYEAVQVFYDSEKISYTDLLQIFWRQIDPTDADGSFVDRGAQYASVIFYHNDEQRLNAEHSKFVLEEIKKYDNPIETKILPLIEFFDAEDYHQDYYKKNKLHYKSYRFGSGRDQYRKEFWGDDKDYNVEPEVEKLDLKSKLTPLQYNVTQEQGTEKPFENEYWDNKEEGIYVDIISGEPLFSSKDKFESGTGWPSFTKPIRENEIVLKEDKKFGWNRTEIRSKDSDSHLGHLFEDAPKELGGVRYCVNSAALKFIPKDKLKDSGYEDFLENL